MSTRVENYLNSGLWQRSRDLPRRYYLCQTVHEDVIFTRKSRNCAGTAFVQGDSAGGSKLTEQTLKSVQSALSDC